MPIPLRSRLLPITLVALALLAWLPALDTIATERVEDALKRALATYAVARTLNAVISVAQETTVSVGVVVGATVAPGQALDPVNDLIEQFSSLMLVAAASLGVQRVLIAIGGQPVFAAALSLALVAAAVVIWRGGRMPPWAARGVLALLLVRFAVPAAVLASDAGYRWVLQDDYTRSQQGIQQVSAETAARQGDTPKVDPMRWLRDVVASAERVVDDVIRLVTVFVMQTLLLPLLTLWALVVTGRMLTGSLRGPPASG
jgi:hypothetical protein